MGIHERIEDLAGVYAAGGLEEAERREVEAHAAACAGCAAVLREARDFASWASGAIAPDAPPDDLEDGIVERLWDDETHYDSGGGWTPVLRAAKWVGAAAAVFVLIVLGAAFSVSGLGSPRMLAMDSISTDKERHYGYAPQAPTSEAALGLEIGALDEAVPVTASLALKRDFDRNMKLAEEAPAEDALKDADVLVMDAKGKVPAGGLEATIAEGKPTPASFQENRKIIRNAQLDLEVDSYETTQKKIDEIAAAEKGFVAGADTRRLPNGKMQATVTLRIPPDRFEAALARLRELGTVRHQSITSQDVTKTYVDLESRLASKQALVERLKKVLAEAKGSVKELMEVEVQMGKTIEEIESIKGELKYYDNLVGLSTIILKVSEKDLGKPFEYVQTLQSTIGITAEDADAAYAKAQKEILDAGGQVVDSKMTRRSDESATGTIRGKVDAEKFPEVREKIKALGHVTADTVDRRRTARGGQGEDAPAADAPVKREQAVIDLTISTPPLVVTRTAEISVEAGDVEKAYQAARQAVLDAGGRIVDGSLSGRTDRTSASVKAQVDADRFADVVAKLKEQGKVLNAAVNHTLPPEAAEGKAPLVRERAEIALSLQSPPKLIGEEHGLLRTIRDTFSNSIAGLMWSIEKLFVGISIVGPWVAIVLLGWYLYRFFRRRMAAREAE